MRIYTINDVIALRGTTRQAIFSAIKQKRLNANKIENRWTITEDDLRAFIMKRYDRAHSKKDGHLIFDKEKGFYSVKESSNLIGCNIQHVYYALRKKWLYSDRKGGTWVIHIVDIMKYKEMMNRPKKERVA